MFKRALVRLSRDERGHAAPGTAGLAAAAGGIILAAGAAGGEDVITIIGGIVLAVGVLGSEVLGHMQVDYPIYDRLNKLEGKDSDGGD